MVTHTLTPAPVDLDRWRRDTPGCRDRIHLNNAGAGLMPRPVLVLSFAFVAAVVLFLVLQGGLLAFFTSSECTETCVADSPTEPSDGSGPHPPNASQMSAIFSAAAKAS